MDVEGSLHGGDDSLSTENAVQAEVISIGDELVSGQRLDTNSQWLSQQLADLGVSVIRHSTVGDDLQQNIEAFRLATGRAAIVVCTGGLGPTLDDLTRQALAEAFERPLQLDPASLEQIAALFASRGRKMPERNRLQAMLPSAAQVIPNPHGSAPGIDMQVVDQGRSSRIFALPGVPAEMVQMWHETVAPRIVHMLGGTDLRWRYHTLRLFGIGESDVEVALPDLIDRQRLPTVGITVSRATITLRIAAQAASEAAFREVIAPTITEIQAVLGDLIFGEGEDELEHVVLRQLGEQRRSFACVEVGAASFIGDWMLKAAEPNRNCFGGSLAFPTVQHAEQWAAQDDVSSEPGASCWERLALLARKRFRADVGMALGVYPTQTQMENSQAPFEFHYALASAAGVITDHRTMGGHPDVLGPRAAKTGLDLVRRFLFQL